MNKQQAKIVMVLVFAELLHYNLKLKKIRLPGVPKSKNTTI